MISRTDNLRGYVIDCLKVFSGCFVVLWLFKILDIDNKNTNDMNVSKSLIDQANKWYNVSIQDKNSFYALQHANYSVAYLNAARHSTSDNVLEQITGFDIHKLYKKIDENQRNQSKDIITKSNLKVKQKNLHSQPSWIS